MYKMNFKIYLYQNDYLFKYYLQYVMFFYFNIYILI